VLKAFQLSNGLLSKTPVMQGAATFGCKGAQVVVSANGNLNGIVWAMDRNTTNNNGTLYAYDATDLGHELYDSNQVSSRDALTGILVFTEPLVANGKVYIGTISSVEVFGLLPGVSTAK
jgi:hypothetical protein